MNSLTASDKQSWARKMQIVREKELVALGFCNFELRAGLKTGYRAHKPYRSKMAAQSYTKGTAFTVQDISSTNEYLDVDTAKCVPFYVNVCVFAQQCASKLDKLLGHLARQVSYNGIPQMV